jgi:uncharacterized protein YndB with AHSA1/START domain
MTSKSGGGPSDALVALFQAIRDGDVEAMIAAMEPESFADRYGWRPSIPKDRPSVPAEAIRSRDPNMPQEVAEYHAAQAERHRAEALPNLLKEWQVATVEELEQITPTDVVRHELRQAMPDGPKQVDCEVLGEVLHGPDRAYVVFRTQRLGTPFPPSDPTVATMARVEGVWRWVVARSGVFELEGYPVGVGVYEARPFTINWKVHLRAAPEVVYQCVTTDEGRATFWADEAPEENGVIRFSLPNGKTLASKVLRAEDPHVFECRHFNGSVVTFEFQDDGRGGTDLHLQERGWTQDGSVENWAGWVSVLLALKAAVDHGVDLRNHDLQRTWDQGFVDN